MYGDEGRRKATPRGTNLGGKNVGRGSSVVEQRSEEPCVASSILALGTKRFRLMTEFFDTINSMYYVYLLQSQKDKNYYIGQTEDIARRIKEHTSGKVASTKNRLPIQLVGFEIHGTQSKARFREYSLKKNAHQRKKFIECITRQDIVASLRPYGP